MRTGGLPIGKEKPRLPAGAIFPPLGWELFGKNGKLAMIEGENRTNDHILNTTAGRYLNHNSKRICMVIDMHRGVGTMGITIGVPTD